MEDIIQVMGNGFAGGIAPSKGPNIKGGSSAGSFSTSFAHTLRASECQGTDKEAATTRGNAAGGNKDPLRRHDFPSETYGSSVAAPTQSDTEDKVRDGTSDRQLFSASVGNDYQTNQPNFSSIHGYSLSAPVGENVRRLIHDDAFDFLALQLGTSSYKSSDDVLVAASHGPRALISVDGFAHVLSHDESEVGTMVQQEGASAFGKIDRQSLDSFVYRETRSSWEQYRSSGGVSDRSVVHRNVSFGIENRLLGDGGNQGTAFYEGKETDATLSQRAGLISQDPSLLSNRVGVNHTESSQTGILFPDIKVSEQKSVGVSSTQVLGSEVRLRDPESFSTDLSTHLRVLKAQGGGEARLQLNPAEMGRMLVTVTTQGEDTRVAFVVESAQVKQVIEASLPRLRDLLEQSGMQLTDSDVRDRTSDHSNRGSGSEYQTQESETDDASHADVIAVNTDKRHLLDAYA
jgi:hypothetical protein